MWRVMCILLTICLLSAAVSAADEGTRLDLASVPEDWILLGEYAAGAGDLQVFSERLGVTVVVLKNYLFGTPTGGVQVNLVLTETEAEAQALEELFLGFHPPEMVGRSGRRVLELVTEQPALAELAKTALRFDLEGTSGADQAVLREYLKAWSWSVARWEDIAEYLDGELADYRVFLVGETHGAACNQQLESALLEFLVRQGGVQNLLLELSPSLVGFLREYLETGDQALLDQVFSLVKGTYFFTEENYVHWQKVHDLYQSLPEGKELRLIGLDVEHQPLLALSYLQRHLDRIDSSILSQSKLGQIDRILRGELSLDYNEALSFVQDLLLELQQKAVRAELGELAGEFELVLSSLLAGLQLQTFSGLAWDSSREQAMYENFVRQVSPDDGQKYFGQWGLHHVFQGQVLGVDWLASKIARTERFSDSVFSMVLVYSGGERLSQDGSQTMPLSTYAGSTQVLPELAGGQPLLAKLDSAGSPFTEELIWKLTEVSPASGVTTDYFQYLLFIPGAQASTPLVF